jgi:hypothetical protein
MCLVRVIRLRHDAELQKMFAQRGSNLNFAKRTKGVPLRARATFSRTKGLQTKPILDHERFDVQNKLLHSNTHKISAWASKNDARNLYNVRLMRDLEPDNATNWNGTCCLTASSRSHHVKRSSCHRLNGID